MGQSPSSSNLKIVEPGSVAPNDSTLRMSLPLFDVDAIIYQAVNSPELATWEKQRIDECISEYDTTLADYRHVYFVDGTRLVVEVENMSGPIGRAIKVVIH